MKAQVLRADIERKAEKIAIKEALENMKRAGDPTSLARQAQKSRRTIQQRNRNSGNSV